MARPDDSDAIPFGDPGGENLAGHLWSMPTPFVVSMLASGEVLLVNRAFEQVTGFTADDLVGRRITETGIFVDAAAREALARRLEADGTLDQMEIEIRTRTGENRLVSVSARRSACPGGDRIITLFVDITARKHMELALRDSEERYRRLFHESADATMVLAWEAGADSGRVVEANDCAAQLLGIPREELPGMGLETWDAPDNVEPIGAIGRRLGATDVAKFERTVRTRHGRTLVLEIICCVFHWRDRRFVLAGLRDLTSHRELERRLLQSDVSLRAAARRFERLMEAAPTGILLADRRGRITHLNPAAETIAGRSSLSLTGSSIDVLVAPADAGRLAAAWRALEAGHPDARAEVRIERTSGESRWVLLRLHAFPSADRPDEVIASLTDLTEQHLATELLRALLQARSSDGPVLSHALAGLAPIFGADCACLTVHEPVAQNDRLAACWRDGAMWPDAPGPAVDALRRELLENQTRMVESELAALAPETTAQLAPGANAALVLPLPSDRGATCGHLCLFWRRPQRDGVAVRQLAELAILPLAAEIEREREAVAKRQIETQLLQSQKFEALGALASGIAHDFNNVLAAVLNYTTLLRTLDASETADRHYYLDELAAAVHRARDLVGRIASFSRQRPQPSADIRQPVNLGQVVGDALRFLRPAILPAIRIEFEAGPEPMFVRTDSTRMHQVVLNLIVNASQAVGEQPGTITLALDTCELPGARSGLRLPPGRYVRLTVSDTGIGIPADVLPRIFEPFFTTRVERGGSGLGLAIVRQIAEEHGGAVTADSEPGAGSVFSLFLPALAAEDTVPSPGDTSPSRGGGGTRRQG